MRMVSDSYSEKQKGDFLRLLLRRKISPKAETPIYNMAKLYVNCHKIRRFGTGFQQRNGVLCRCGAENMSGFSATPTLR